MKTNPCAVRHGDFMHEGGQTFMRGNQARVKRAMELALEHLDYIIDHHTAPDFVEVTGRMGGDVITYRIYNDGSMYER